MIDRGSYEDEMLSAFFSFSYSISRFDCLHDIYTVTYFYEMPYVNYSFHILHGDKIVIVSYAWNLFK